MLNIQHEWSADDQATMFHVSMSQGRVDICNELHPEQIDHLMGALPGCSNERRRKLVRSILAEWGRIDVEGYLRQPLLQQLRAKRKALEKLASYANKLAQTLSILEPSSRFTIAYHMSKGKVGAETPFLAWYSGIRDNDRRLSEAPASSKDWRRP
jgi:hypothetical protein